MFSNYCKKGLGSPCLTGGLVIEERKGSLKLIHASEG
jgi:hypothetical protein